MSLTCEVRQHNLNTHPLVFGRKGPVGRRGTGGESSTPSPNDPAVDDIAPTASLLTAYDEKHAVTYLRLLDAETQGADWKQVARIVLRIDPLREAGHARRAFDTHLARAHWMTQHGYRHLARASASSPYPRRSPPRKS